MRKAMNILCCCSALLVIGRALAAPHHQESSVAPATQVVEMTGDK